MSIYNRLMQPKRLFVSALIFLAALMATHGCSKSDSANLSTIPGQNVLLITLDTTRADHIGCYGHQRAKTPALDAIAARGVLFEDALSQIPLTLPSHCTMMTGRYPREFGVRVNNEAALGTTHPTLASILKQKGYHTAAFVASFVLDSRFGLDRGFDVYDDEMSNVSIKTGPLEWERPGSVVTDHALAWLNANKASPFFCWVHFYDPHGPYQPPKEFPPTYDGEVAFMDTQVKRLDDWLTTSGLKNKTLVVVVGDHGESFNEHGEDGHGIFLYQTNIHVPLMVAHPSLTPTARRVSQPVGVVDVFPTILELLELPRPDKLLSTSLAGALQSGQSPPHEIFSESEYVWHSYGWAQQRGLTNSDWKFISSTKPELYDRKADPDEKINVIDRKPDVRAELSNKLFQRYSEQVPTLPGKVAPSAAATAALSALGYTGGGSKSVDEFLTQGADDPKDKIEVFRKYQLARKLWGDKQLEPSIALMRECVKEAPQSPSLQGALGVALVNTKKYEEALVFLDAAAKLDSTHQPALFSSGEAYFYLNRFDKALQYFTLAVENDPNDPTAHFMLGRTLLVLKKPDEARPQFEKAVELLPEFPSAHFELAELFFGARDYDRAIQHFRQTIRYEPNNDNAHYNLGSSLVALKKIPDAVTSFRETVRINPKHGQGWMNLGLTLLQTGQTAEGKKALLQAAAIPDVAADAYYNLAIAASRENDAAASAQYLQKVIDVAPTHPTAAWDLARDYLKADRTDKALEVLRAAEKANPSNVRTLNLLASILATTTNDALRNGQEALPIAKKTAELTQSRNPMVLKTLAEAYAETGDFPNAIATAKQALQMTPPDKLEDLRKELSASIADYEAGRPTRKTRFVQPGP